MARADTRTCGQHFNPRSHEGSDMIDTESLQKSIISIHAPTRGATQAVRQRQKRLCNFNPRSHEGSDQKRRTLSPTIQDFNPRSHEGSDSNVTMYFEARNKFQSTLPRGERPVAVINFPGDRNFNPRSHEGSDLEDFRQGEKVTQFQSTLPRGERRKKCM